MTAYSRLNMVIQGKIDILQEEPYLEKVESNVLIHYKKSTIDKAMKQIIAENPNYIISYTIETNSVSLTIKLS